MIKPMKAKRWPRKDWTYPCIVQPKLNGIRALWDGRTLNTNDLQVWHESRLPHIFDILHRDFSGIPLDGELYCHGMALQHINERVAVMSRKTHADVERIQYHVFDTPVSNPQEQRSRWVREFLPRIGPIIQVDTYVAHDEAFVDMAHKMFRDNKYEGTMIRDFSAPYGFLKDCGNQENRWAYILKRKDWLDVVARCVGVEEGEGKYANMVGSLQFVLPNGVHFSASSGLTDAYRLYYWDVQPIGLDFAIDFDEYSDSGVPMRFKKIQHKTWS